MSTIAVDNIKPSAGGTAFSTGGVAKAWVNFNGTGVVAARDSVNVTSLTDNGTGDYTINFTNNLADTNYNSTMSCGQDNTGNSGLRSANALSNTTRTVSAIRMGTATVSSTANRTSLDDDTISATVHGDLA